MCFIKTKESKLLIAKRDIIVYKDGKVLYKEYIAIRCKDGDVGFYTPTQCDVLAEDWKIITE